MKSFVYLKNVATLSLDREKCVGCGMCLTVCPHAVWIMDNNRVRIGDLDQCMECGACQINCPVQAIKVETGVGCAAAVINSILPWAGSGCCSLDSPINGGQRVAAD